MFEIGNTLREARVRRKLTLQQVEEDTKIRVKYLQAMENEEFEIMPGATYAMGFLRTYSKYLELDPEVIVGEYRSRDVRASEPPEPFGGSSVVGPPRSHRGRNTVLFVAVVCLLALGIFYVLGLRGGEETPSTQPESLGIVSPSASAGAGTEPRATPTSTASAVADELRVTALDDVWIKVRRTGPTGAVLYAGTLSKGTTKRLVGDVLWVRLANPGSVVLRVEGRRLARITDPGPVSYLVKDGQLERQD